MYFLNTAGRYNNEQHLSYLKLFLFPSPLFQSCHLLTRGMVCVRKCFESKISKPTKLDCKQNVYYPVYYITLNSICEAQRASKNLKKIVKDRVGSQK